MAKIEKKMWPESYELVLTGQKTYDLRLADWHIQPDDTIVFREWDPKTSEYTGRSMEKHVGYVGKTKDWEVWPKEDIEKYGFQVISLLDMPKPSLQQLTQALHQSWDAETGYAGPGVWSPSNPARGQCVVSSLVVQDYFGGDLVRYAVTGENINETHHSNVLDDGTIIDTTGSQYTVPVTMKPKPVDLKQYASLREKRLDDDETRQRYLLLKSKVAEVLMMADFSI